MTSKGTEGPNTTPATAGSGTYRGFATMYMRMPMSSSTLPIQGQCSVDDRRITLKFPFTGIEFDLPGPPRESRTNEYDFTIRSQRGDMTMTIGYITELRAFTGVGRMTDAEVESGGGDVEAPVLTFCFFAPDSPLSRLPKI